jgi:PhoH-like ATPase
MAKKTYVIDTSVFLSDANALYRFKNNDIVIPMKVLEEIDKHKKRQDSVGFNARLIIKHLDSLRSKGSLAKGIRLGKGMGILKVAKASTALPEDLDFDVPDHQILSVAVQENLENEKRKVIVVSRDINMRVIADALGLTSEDYATNSVIEDKDKVYEGFAEVLVDDEFIEQFYQGKDMCLDESMLKERLYPNQFLLLISSSNPKKSAICRFHELKRPLQQINVKDYSRSWGIKPRNKEQTFAYDLLFDPEVPLVSLIGRAGSGKTLMAIAAGLEQCLGIEERRYKKLVVSRPVQPMGKDIGFLPNTSWATSRCLSHSLRKARLKLKPSHTFEVDPFPMHSSSLTKHRTLQHMKSKQSSLESARTPRLFLPETLNKSIIFTRMRLLTA